MYKPSSKQEFLSVLEIIGITEQFDGVLIQILSHMGAQTNQVFGRPGEIEIQLSDLVDPMQNINQRCNGNLILYMTMMCSSYNLLPIAQDYPGMFHAGIFSMQTQSIQNADQIISIYEKCLTGTNITQDIKAITNRIGNLAFQNL